MVIIVIVMFISCRHGLIYFLLKMSLHTHKPTQDTSSSGGNILWVIWPFVHS